MFSWSCFHLQHKPGKVKFIVKNMKIGYTTEFSSSNDTQRVVYMLFFCGIDSIWAAPS